MICASRRRAQRRFALTATITARARLLVAGGEQEGFPLIFAQPVRCRISFAATSKEVGEGPPAHLLLPGRSARTRTHYYFAPPRHTGHPRLEGGSVSGKPPVFE